MSSLRNLLPMPLILASLACSDPAPTNDAIGPTPSATKAAARPTPSEPARPILTLEGFGDLIIGKPVPGGSGFAVRGAQASDSCLTYTDPAFPGTYAIVEAGTVRRVTVGRDSPVRLAEGIGIGATEQEVLAAFPGFVSAPHTYVEAPAKYLTQPGSDPRLRFEIGANGKVTDIHVGLAPQLHYVEGCA